MSMFEPQTFFAFIVSKWNFSKKRIIREALRLVYKIIKITATSQIVTDV